MKKVFILYFVLLLSSACQTQIKKEDITQSSPSAKTVSKSLDVEKCCEVKCNRGPCSTTKSPCTCTCVGKMPRCAGGTTGVAEDELVLSTNAQMMGIVRDIKFLHNMKTKYATLAANHLQNVYDLLSSRGGRLSQGADIAIYKRELDAFGIIYNNHFSQRERDNFENMD